MSAPECPECGSTFLVFGGLCPKCDTMTPPGSPPVRDSTLIAEAAIKRHHALKARHTADTVYNSLSLYQTPGPEAVGALVAAHEVLAEADVELERHIEDLLAKAREAAS